MFKFVYKTVKQEIIKQLSDMFEDFYTSNVKENKSIVHYEFDKDEYLEDIIFQKFNFKVDE